MTWLSFATRSLNLIIVIPLVLKIFDVNEIALWLLFSVIIGLQSLLDFGFTPTFIRVIAYAFGGTSERELSNPKTVFNGRPNWDSLIKIYGTMRVIYFRLSIIWFGLITLVGTLAVYKQINHLNEPIVGWESWVIIVIISGINIIGFSFSSLLQGANKIALLRRWESIFSLGSIFTSFIVLLLGGGMVELVFANQIWIIFTVLRNYYLVRTSFPNLILTKTDKLISNTVFDAVKSSSWKSGLGVFMSYGITQLTGVFFAQLGSSEEVAIYLFALRIIVFINQFSQAPFYSKIPRLSKLYAEKRFEEIISISKKGMRYAYFSYTIPFLTLDFGGEKFLSVINSRVPFPNENLWLLLGIAFLFERFGAMHIQLFSLSNNIIWHIANGVSGFLNLLVVLITYRFLGVLAFPLGMFVGYVMFYCWYSAKKSYELMRTNFFAFEKTVFIPNLLIFLLAVCF